MRRTHRVSGVLGCAVALSLVAAGLGAVAEAATSPSAVLAQAVSAVPGTGTPQISNGMVLAMAQVGGTMVAGGSFTMAGGVAASNIARYNPTTNRWSALGPLRPEPSRPLRSCPSHRHGIGN